MKIHFNESSQELVIDDNIRNQYMAIYFLMGVNLFNSFVNIYRLNDGVGNLALEYVWIGVGVVCLGVILWLALKKTTQKTILLSEIEGLKFKKRFGNSQLSLRLKNGRSRDTVAIKDKTKAEEMKNHLLSLGIKLLDG
ncbi:MAG: hypothetical protein AAFY71_15965 [Bacteroidota bacterium]